MNICQENNFSLCKRLENYPPGPSQPSRMPDSSLTRLCCSCLRFTWSMLCATWRIMA